MYDEIADAAEDRAPYLAETARAHHDVAGLLARCHLDDELARLLEVRDEFTAQLSSTTSSSSSRHVQDKTQTKQTHRQLPTNTLRQSSQSYIIYQAGPTKSKPPISVTLAR